MGCIQKGVDAASLTAPQRLSSATFNEYGNLLELLSIFGIQACGRALLLAFAHTRSAAHRAKPVGAASKGQVVTWAYSTPSLVAAGTPLGNIKDEADVARRKDKKKQGPAMPGPAC
jgi:hypothetical protein